MMSLHLDDRNGVIHTVARGATNRDEIEKYLLDLAELMEGVRRRWGRCLHLVDACRLSVRADRDLCSLAGTSIEFQEFDDRVAVVMRSPRAAEYLDHMPSQFRTVAFRNRKSALAWLGAAHAGDFEVL